jgi:hypothetical protein
MLRFRGSSDLLWDRPLARFIFPYVTLLLLHAWNYFYRILSRKDPFSRRCFPEAKTLFYKEAAGLDTTPERQPPLFRLRETL